MMLPHQWAVLTVDEATNLMAFIEKMTATKGISRNYEKIQKAGILREYDSLRQFVEYHAHYEDQLRHLDRSDFARRDD